MTLKHTEGAGEGLTFLDKNLLGSGYPYKRNHLQQQLQSLRCVQCRISSAVQTLRVSAGSNEFHRRITSEISSRKEDLYAIPNEMASKHPLGHAQSGKPDSVG